MKGGRVVGPVDKEVLFAVSCIGRARDLNHLQEENGLHVFLVVEHVDTREDGGILEGGEALLVRGSHVRRGRHRGGGRRRTEIRDVFHGRAIACSPYRGWREKRCVSITQGTKVAP